MEEILESLARTPGVQGSLIVGKDGLVIAAAGSPQPDADMLGATTAEYFSSIENGVGSTLERGSLDLVSVEASEGRLFLKGINDGTYLLVSAEASANLGLIRHEMKVAAEQLREQL